MHNQSALGVEYIIKNSLLKKTLDNVTVVMISFAGFERYLNSNDASDHRPTAYSVSPRRENGQMANSHTRHFSTNKCSNLPPSQQATPKKSYNRKTSANR